MTGMTPLPLIQRIRDEVAKLPECEGCGARTELDDRTDGVVHVRRRHVFPCAGLGSVTITAGDLTGTHA